MIFVGKILLTKVLPIDFLPSVIFFTNNYHQNMV